MFAEIQFTSLAVEVLLSDYLLQGELRSRGDIVIYLNDRNYPSFILYDCALSPLDSNRRVETIKQDMISVEKAEVAAVSALDKTALENAHLSVARRMTTIYVSRFAIHGYLHVPADAPDEDLLDETRDFFGITEGSIYPLIPVGTTPFEKPSLLLVNRGRIQAYNVQES